MAFTITRAALRDRQAVINLSELFKEDYLEYTVDRWIAQDQGGLYLVWDGELLVGCCSLYFPSNSEAWLQGMRVHPDYQGKGIAYSLNKHLIEQAETEGATTVRLLTSEDNHPAMKVAQNLGFSPAGGRREIIFRAPLKTDNIDIGPGSPWISGPRPCSFSELDRAARFLNAGSASLNQNKYIFGPGYYYRRLELIDLERAAKDGSLFIFEEQARVSGIMLLQSEKEDGHLIVSHLDVPLNMLAPLAAFFPAWFKEGYYRFTLSLLAEQHRVLNPLLKQLFGNYEYETWLLMEKNLISFGSSCTETN